MATATMTSKGQITIPVKIRKALGLKSGTRIEFYEIEDGVFALRPKTGSIMDLEGCLANRLNYAPTIEEMDQAVLEYAAKLDAATKSDAESSFENGEAS